MASLGLVHIVCLRCDGEAWAASLIADDPTLKPRERACIDIPRAGPDMRYTQVVAGGDTHYTLLLRSDGQVVGLGQPADGQTDIPRLPCALRYTQISAASSHCALLRSDGIVIVCGDDEAGELRLPPLPEDVTYTQVSCGTYTIAALRSDGAAIVCGDNRSGQCVIPDLEDGVYYTQVAAGTWHTVFLRSDGQVVASGWGQAFDVDAAPLLPEGPGHHCHWDGSTTVEDADVTAGVEEPYEVLRRRGPPPCPPFFNRYRHEYHGECSIPDPPSGVHYTQVSASEDLTVLLRSDGQAIACGANEKNQCNIPPVPHSGAIYTQVTAGSRCTVLLRSDGRLTHCGFGGHRILSPLESGFHFVKNPTCEPVAAIHRHEPNHGDHYAPPVAEVPFPWRLLTPLSSRRGSPRDYWNESDSEFSHTG